jgi:DeoR family transcriptional regulator, fructose operon transcriptional repressor
MTARRRDTVGSSLDAEARRRRVRELLQVDGFVTLSEAADALGVSEMTIRRDLQQLELAGVLRRVRGGAIAVGPQLFQRRQAVAAVAKRVIAHKLLETLPVKGAVVLDASSTMHRFAADLEDTNLTVVTTGIETFSLLSGRGIHAVLTGGELERSTGALVGSAAHRTINDYVFECSYLSSTALSLELGAMESTAHGAEVKRIMKAAARRTILAVDSTKLAMVASARVFDVDEADVLVTELDPSDPELDGYRSRVELL